MTEYVAGLLSDFFLFFFEGLAAGVFLGICSLSYRRVVHIVSNFFS